MCKNCGGPTPPPKSHNAPRTYCAAPACQREARRLAGLKGQRGRHEYELTTKRCAACGKTKRRTTENFAPTRRDPESGKVLGYQTYCRPCTRAYARDKYRTNRDRREQARQRAARRHDKIRARRAVDPDFDSTYRALRRTYKRKAREGGPDRRLASDPPLRERSTSPLPVAPLAAYVRTIVEREEESNPWAVREDGDLEGHRTEAVCERAGIAPRQLYAWLHGERELVQFDVADRVLARLDILWHDVWPPERYPEVAAILGAV